MRYVLKQKIWSWGDDFVIKDESGREVLTIDGKVWSWGDQLTVRDMDGHEVAHIKQKLLSWGPTYEIHEGGELMAVVKKELFSFFKCRFTVDVPGPNDLEAEGDFMDHEYTFRRRRTGPVATVSKRWFSWADTYGVDVARGEDEVLILASTVVIDLACHPSGQD